MMMEFGAGPTRSAIFFSYIIFSVGSIKSVGNIHPDPDMSHDWSKISKILHPVHGHECHTTVYVRLVNYKHTIGQHLFSVFSCYGEIPGVDSYSHHFGTINK